MTKDQQDELQTIADNLSIIRETLRRFCFHVDTEDITGVGDGLPGSLLYTLNHVVDCLDEMNAAMKALSPADPPGTVPS